MQCVLRDLRGCRPLGKSKGTKDKERCEQSRVWLGGRALNWIVQWRGELRSFVKAFSS